MANDIETRELLKYVETVRGYLHEQIGKPTSSALASAPEIALNNLKSKINELRTPSKTSQDIVAEVNSLAHKMLTFLSTGYKTLDEDFLFYRAPAKNVRARLAWERAVEIYEMITASEVHDALLEVEKDSERSQESARIQAERIASKPNLYLDLDGVMFDFEGHFLTVFGVAHDSMTDDEMWEKINTLPDFFATIPLFDGAVDFFKSIEHLDPIILTSCPKSNYRLAATQKRACVRRHLSEHVTILPVRGASAKPLFMHMPGDILIDDYSRNIKQWTEHGGIGILHRNFADTHKALENCAVL